MKKITENFKKIFEEHKMLFGMQIVLFVMALALLIFSFLIVGSNASVVKTAYGDIGRYQGGEWSSMSNSGGYYDDVWTEYFAYAIFAIIFGVLHNLIAVKIFEKKGSGMAMFFVLFSIGLVMTTFLVFGRLLGEA